MRPAIPYSLPLAVLSLVSISGCGLLNGTCKDTSTNQWLLISVEHAERPGTYTYAVDADGVAGTCTWTAGEPGAWPDCEDMPWEIYLIADETGVEQVTVEGAPDRVSLRVSRDGEVLFDQVWTPDYEITRDKKPGCGPDGLRGELTASF